MKPQVILDDPILIDVMRYKLEGIAEEMQTSLVRSSYSPIVKEAQDASCCVFQANGEVIVQSRSNPSHLGSLAAMVESVLAEYPVDEMEEGDIFIFNDPYLGGTHLPDIAVFTPVVTSGKPIAIAAAMAHHMDVGGMLAGSIPTNATEIYQEGLRLPPVKLASRGQMDRTILSIIRRNVRMPDILEGDLSAQISACRIAERGLMSMAEEYGADTLVVVFAELLDRSERLTRNALKALPQGTFSFEDELDNDGVDLDKPIRICVAATIADGSITFDFTGSSPQVKGPLNIVPCGVRSSAYYGVRAITDEAIPTNGGCFRCVDMILPEGSVVNPREPAPVNGRTAVMKRIASCLIGALAQALPEQFPAGSAASVLVMSFAGNWPDGRPFVQGELVNGGSGAALGHDGVSAIATDMTNGRGIPAEAIEMEAPIRCWNTSLRIGSGGQGQWNGGMGIVREYEILSDEVRFSHRGERHNSVAKGLLGGADGQSANSVVTRLDGSEEILTKAVLSLRMGDRLRVETPGGGGYGQSEDRSSDLKISRSRTPQI